MATDTPTPSSALLRSVAARAAGGDVQFRLVVLNPARAEVHLLHPERHDKAFEAERILLETLPQLEDEAGGRVIGSVSVRHDPVDAIEEIVQAEPVDELWLSMAPAETRRRAYQHLLERVRRFGVPVTSVE